MPRILTFVLALIAAVSAPASEPQQDYTGAYFKRQLYVVSDMDRALTLWRDVIGFQPGDVTTSGENSYSREVFNVPQGVRMRFVTLSAGPAQIRTLALLEVPKDLVPPKTGVRMTAAVVDARGRLDEIAAKAKQLGLTVFSRRDLPSQTQGMGVEQGFLDWDGNVIVLYQFPTAAPPSAR
jgi:catechol 2,3-dioxygenase-like lactoylglutathione lyase family enzyme